ncbi:hypothetical protein HN51_063606 [Arachis hypogaea]|uniref:Senescence regulator n=1 Tax=Arachis hypogaea TaxID=3818 RepID=A0A445AXH6_ARAHY|nr:uncharacterized protein LOC107637251 [Arachis ipaensis]XP_025629906.1 uncharacterized protein LOC112722929 [Arachis hypogaea]QHO21189.1 uncharacterized protein DS421_11g344520 [Arachis hypogaea]RYR31128.1 hypothetical protein Ahy_B01g055918 [Arachis hypogaea]
MAKGRKLTTARSDRFLAATTTYSHVSTASETSEFREEDIWSSSEDRDRHLTLSHDDWEPRASPRRREGHSHHRHVGGLSLAFEDPKAGTNNGAMTATSSSRIVHQYRAQHDAVSSRRGRHVAASAPVNVPDWSKILRVDSVESLHEMKDSFDDEDDDDGDSEMVPPHEYLARSRKMAANSVFEGVGRTLKGRDMRRVRDAVWSQTGFYG